MVVIRRVSRMESGLLPRSLLCGTAITGIEYVIGRAFNRDHRIWDYRHQPMNVQGQVCLPYSLLWCGLSAGILGLMDVLD